MLIPVIARAVPFSDYDRRAVVLYDSLTRLAPEIIVLSRNDRTPSYPAIPVPAPSHHDVAIGTEDLIERLRRRRTAYVPLY